MMIMQHAAAPTPESKSFYHDNGGCNKVPLWERLHASVTPGRRRVTGIPSTT
jgi:hypothetical protein